MSKPARLPDIAERDAKIARVFAHGEAIKRGTYQALRGELQSAAVIGLAGAICEIIGEAAEESQDYLWSLVSGILENSEVEESETK